MIKTLFEFNDPGIKIYSRIGLCFQKTHIYIYIYIYREREREREGKRDW